MIEDPQGTNDEQPDEDDEYLALLNAEQDDSTNEVPTADETPAGAEQPAGGDAAAPAAAETPQQPAARDDGYYAPGQAGALTDRERQAAAELFDEEQIAFIEGLTRRVAETTIASHAAQQNALRRSGLQDAFVNEFGPELQRTAAFIPPTMRGTKEGAQYHAQAAIAARAEQTGDFVGTMRMAADMLGPKPANAAGRSAAPPPSTTVPRVVQPGPGARRPVRSRQEYLERHIEDEYGELSKRERDDILEALLGRR